MNTFTPDYRNIVLAASNIEAPRLPLYEHNISEQTISDVLGHPIRGNPLGSYDDALEYMTDFCAFFLKMGYDIVSFEACITSVFPDGGALGSHKQGAIRSRADFERYPFKAVPDLYFNTFSNAFKALREAMPAGMKAIGGVGNGIFECVQDLTGYMDLCYIAADDPDLYAELFQTIGDTALAIWSRFLAEFGDVYCVCRFGDDLGFKSTTLISAEDIREHVIPQYKRIIDTVHQQDKKFLLHSCGAIFDVMDDLIAAGIDAKHSNEDQIARFPVWVEKYGHQLGNFGGIDTDAVCRLDRADMEEYIHQVLRECEGHGGLAFASGNSIPAYVPTENYCNMIEIIRKYRGDF